MDYLRRNSGGSGTDRLDEITSFAVHSITATKIAATRIIPNMHLRFFIERLFSYGPLSTSVKNVTEMPMMENTVTTSANGKNGK